MTPLTPTPTPTATPSPATTARAIAAAASPSSARLEHPHRLLSPRSPSTVAGRGQHRQASDSRRHDARIAPASPTRSPSQAATTYKRHPPPVPTQTPRRAMSSSGDKSRKRGGATGHVLRAGSSHLNTRAAVAAANPSTGSMSAASNGSPSGGGMPAPPPRVAMASATVGNNDEAIDSAIGGVPLTDRGDMDRDGQRSHEGNRGGRNGSPTGSHRSRASTRTSKDHQASEAAASAAALQAAREKDARIMTLQNELLTLEQEYHRQLDKAAQSESEMATFWQAKHSSLNQQFLRTDTDLRILRTEFEDREVERDELRAGCDALRRTLAARDEELRLLRSQVRGLKEFVSTSTRTDGQQAAADEVFMEAITKLGNGLQNWVITNYRKAKLLPVGDVEISAREEVGELLPMYEELAVNGSKVHLLQSVVSRVLVEMVFGEYYVGLQGDQTRLFEEMEKMLASFSVTDEAVNQWRSSTLALLRREASSQLHESTSAFTASVTTRIVRVLTSILTLPPTPPNPSTSNSSPEATLQPLVASALDLARNISVQKAVLRVHMPQILPHQRILFDPTTMDDIGGEDEDMLEGREVACVVFPGLIKRGDESGGQLQFRNVITKARVFCAPEV